MRGYAIVESYWDAYSQQRHWLRGELVKHTNRIVAFLDFPILLGHHLTHDAILLNVPQDAALLCLLQPKKHYHAVPEQNHLGHGFRTLLRQLARVRTWRGLTQ